jgi:hypothetical protein
MTTPAITPAPPNIFQQLAEKQKGAVPAPASSGAPSGNIFQQLAEGTYKDPNAEPEVSPEEKASQTRQMLVSGLTGMVTPNMTEQDKTEFAQGKAAGAISVPAIAGMYLGAHAALTAGISGLVPALTKGTVALGEWAAEHPVAAKIIWHSVGAAITGTAAGVGARVAGKVIKAAP